MTENENLFSDKISDLKFKFAKAQYDIKQSNLCDFFLGHKETNNVKIWKIFVLLIIILACLFPNDYLKKFNKNYVFIGKSIIILLSLIIILYFL